MKKFYLLVLMLISVNTWTEEGQITRLNGIDIWWEEYGERDHPTVLMIMGLNSNSQVWPEKFIQGLANEGLHVVIFDNRDIGKSSWLTEEPGFISFLKILPTFVIEYFVDFTLGFMFDEQGRFNMANPAPAEYDLNDMALDGIALLDHLNIKKAHIVGASLGGMISQEMTLNYPDRVLTLTILMSTPGFDTPGLSGPTESFKQSIKKSFLLNLLEKEEEALLVSEIALKGTRFPLDHDKFKDQAKQRIEHGINTSNAQMMAVGASPNRASRLREINLPTLIIHGSEDPLIPLDHGIFLSENIPNSKKLFLDGVGHEIPDEVLSEIIPAMIKNFSF